MTSIWSVLPNETACPSGLWYFDFDIKNICNSYFNSKVCMQSLNGSFRKDIQGIKFKQTPWECDSPIFYHMHTVIIVMILKLWLWNNSSKLRKKLPNQNNFTHWDVFHAQSMSGTITLMLQHSIQPLVKAE